MARPKVYDEELRLRLLDKAGEAISERGTEALSLRSLASSSGTTTAAIYTLFGGKPGLLAALYEEALRRFASHLAGVKSTADPVEDVIRLGHAYRESALADPNYYRVMFGDVIRPSDLTEGLREAAAQTFAPLLTAVTRAVDAGLFKQADPATIATALWANVHGLASLEIGNFLPPQAGPPNEIFAMAVRSAALGWTVAAERGIAADQTTRSA